MLGVLRVFESIFRLVRRCDLCSRLLRVPHQTRGCNHGRLEYNVSAREADHLVIWHLRGRAVRVCDGVLVSDWCHA